MVACSCVNRHTYTLNGATIQRKTDKLRKNRKGFVTMRFALDYRKQFTVRQHLDFCTDSLMLKRFSQVKSTPIYTSFHFEGMSVECSTGHPNQPRNLKIRIS